VARADLYLNQLRAAAFDALPVQSAVTDRTGRIVLTNTGGRGQDAAVGEHYFDVCARTIEAAERLRAHVAAVLAGEKERFEGEFRCRAPGAERWIQVMVQRLASPDFEGAVIAHHDVTERRRAEQQAWHRALHDPLTGLANRSLFQDRLDHAIAGVKRHCRPIALVLLDLDRFKAVNDTLGHPAGDQVLGQVAVRAAGAVRKSDTVARLGGDEFGVILERVERPEAARQAAAELLTAIAEPVALGAYIVRPTASAGIALCPAHGLDAERLIAAADAALYRAKSQKGGQVVMHGPQARACPPAARVA